MEAKNTAWKFIILLGIISLFSDMTHEGARTITMTRRALWSVPS